MKEKNVAKNYVYNLMYQILVMVIPFITTPYLSRVLGAENIGIYSYTISVTTYFILFGSLGIAMYAQREIAYVQDNVEKRSKIFFEILLLRFFTLGISLLLFYVGFCLQGQYKIYYKVLILEIIANVVDISWYFQGLEEFKKTVIRNTLVKIISVISIFVLVKSSNDLILYVVIYAVSTLLGNMSLWLYIPKYIKKIKIKELNVFQHIKPTIALFIPQIATQLYTVLDKTMIGTIISDKSEVGYYEQAQKMVKLLLTIATSLGTVMMPRIANVFAMGDKKKLKEYMNHSFTFITLLTFPLMFGIISISANFVPIFYGAGYEKVIYLIGIISPIIVAIGFSNVIGTQYLLPTKQQKKYTISVISGAIVNFLLNFLLIKQWASIGASIATVVAEMVVTGIQFFLVRKEISIFEVIKISYKYLVAASIMLIGSIGVSYIFTDHFVSLVLQIIVSGAIYFGMLGILKDEMFLYGINKLRKKVKKGVGIK